MDVQFNSFYLFIENIKLENRIKKQILNFAVVKGYLFLY